MSPGVTRYSYFDWGRTECTASRGRQYDIWSYRRGHSFTEDTFEVAYDELTPTPFINLTDRAPWLNRLGRAKPPDRCGSLADTDQDPF